MGRNTIEIMAHTTIIVDEIIAVKLAVPNPVFTGVIKEISALILRNTGIINLCANNS